MGLKELHKICLTDSYRVIITGNILSDFMLNEEQSLYMVEFYGNPFKQFSPHYYPIMNNIFSMN